MPAVALSLSKSEGGPAQDLACLRHLRDKVFHIYGSAKIGNMFRRISRKTLMLLGLTVAGGVFALAALKLWQHPPSPSGLTPIDTNLTKITTFRSVEEFKDYLAKAPLDMGVNFGIGAGARLETMEMQVPPTAGGDKAAMPERVSETNVQVAGLDEPDIVKTDGQEIYYSLLENTYWVPMPLMEPSRTGREDLPLEAETIEPALPEEKVSPSMPVPPSPEKASGVKNIRAFPPADLKLDATIEERGNLLLHQNRLLIFGTDFSRSPQEKILSYDVSNPEQPVKDWELKLEERTHLLTARLYQDQVYLVTQSKVTAETPCPIRPLADRSLSIGCSDIYHPVTPISVDVTYIVMQLDPQSGEVTKTATFVGSSASSAIYMSEGALYLSYYYPGDFVSYLVDFLGENPDLVSATVREKLGRLQGYELSAQAKMTELGEIFASYFQSLSNDEQLRVQNELQDRASDYTKAHKRDLGRTGLIKISVSDLKVAASGAVPGTLLNQFSLDEYQDHLRVATTVGGSSWGWALGWGGRAETANDIYILNQNLKEVGQVLDLGLEERIYSARFVQDKGYLVTFREIDPFYVLDLSDPKKPEVKGELKIPGYSSYLHPISQDLILGIGKEGSQVKISLFDVSSPSNPRELDKYTLSEYWSDILNTHRAFLLDTKHQIFFLPGSQGGYIFSYRQNKLQLVKAVSQAGVQRAVYINDYLYFLGQSRVTVLNETDWEKVTELDL